MKVSNQDLALFCQELAMIQQYGISLYDGLQLLMEDAKNKETKQILEMIAKQVEQGNSLYQSLSSVSIFPAYMLEMIYIGEISGRQDDVLVALAKYYQQAYDLQENIKSSLRYPLIMIVLMSTVIVMLFTTILPIFQQVFQQLGQELTGFSKTMMVIGETCSKYMFVFALLVIGILALYFFFTKTEMGKVKQKNLFATLPFIKQLTLKIEISKFAEGVSVALSSGLDIEESIAIAGKLVSHPILITKLNTCKHILHTEHDITKALKESHIFTGIYGQLLNLALKTGHLDVSFQDIASRYDEEVNTKLIAMVNGIEPTLVILLSLIVGVVLLSIMLPLIGIMANL